MEVCNVEYVGYRWKIRWLPIVAIIFAEDVSRSIYEGMATERKKINHWAVIDHGWCS